MERPSPSVTYLYSTFSSSYLRFTKPTMRHLLLFHHWRAASILILHSMIRESGSVSKSYKENTSFIVAELVDLFKSQQKDIRIKQELKAAAEKKSQQDALQAAEDRRENNMAKVKDLLRDTFGSKVPTLRFSDDQQDPEADEIQNEEDHTASFTAQTAGSDYQIADDIPQPTCTDIAKWFRHIHSGTEIQETLKLCKRPKNMSKLERQHVTDAMIPMGLGEPRNLSQAIRDIKLSLKTMGITSVQCVQKRRWDLRSKLQGAAKELADTNKPFDDTIFGPNLQKHYMQDGRLTVITWPRPVQPFLGEPVAAGVLPVVIKASQETREPRKLRGGRGCSADI